MINKISFKNFKIFKNWQTLELKPITILIGKNNSGKSAVLKLMTLIEGALVSNQPQPVNLVNDDVEIGRKYNDLIYGKFGRALGIKIYQENPDTKKDDELSVEIVVDTTPYIDYWKLNDELGLRFLSNDVYENDNHEEKFCSFAGLNLLSSTTNKKKNETNLKQAFILNTDFICSLRAEVKPYYSIENIRTKKSGLDGINLYNFLIEDYLSTDKKYFNKIADWIKEKFEGWELYIDVDSEPYPIELRKGKLNINLTETGMGIGQVLPLIIRAIKPCTEETLIIIEEPESHLHSYAHAQLAQLFADSIKKDHNKKYLIETHSQNFILRLRRLIAEGELKLSDLGIYYVDFDEDKNESVLKEIKVDDGGGVEWWPTGIFSETSIETRAIYNAQLNDLKNVD
jgi:predicted ATPase